MRVTILALAIAMFQLLVFEACAGSVTIVDVAGRSVTLKRPVERIVLGEGRYIEALGIVEDGNPARRVVGMTAGPGALEEVYAKQLAARWPSAAAIEIVGAGGPESLSVEKIISLKPDVAIFGVADHGPGAKNTELVGQLEKAGISVVFIDFRLDPLANTVRSIEILGRITGGEKRASRFTEIYRNYLDLVRSRTAVTNVERPTAFLQAHLGRMDCCVAMAKGMLGPMVTIAGGRNVSAEVSPGPVGRHTPEFLIASAVDVLIATASGSARDHADGKPVAVLGRGVDAATAQAALRRALELQAGTATLPAWRKGRIHAIWHNFYNSPFNIVALLAFAKWLHPELFADIDPAAVLAELHAEFAPFDLDGTYMITLTK